jgi:hypothetical protein
VSTEEDASWRLTEQRMRNRVMEALETLAGGEAGVRTVGAIEYLEEFFDWVDDDSPWDWRTWSSFSVGEVEGLARVLGLMEAAVRATPQHLSGDELIATGWPGRRWLLQKNGTGVPAGVRQMGPGVVAVDNLHR